MKPFYVSLKPFIDHHTLPRPAQWPSIFNNSNPLDVEIGFGNGEFLAKLADENPDVNYVGFEEYCERISRTLRKLSRAASSNVRVLRMDVRPGLKFLFAPRSIRFMYCLYPPPWPKKSDIKHRYMTREFLGVINNRLIDGGALKVVTDHHPYTDWLEEQIDQSIFDYKRTTIPASYGTKFERKWVEGGQLDFDEILLTKKKHVDMPQEEEMALNHYRIKDFDPDAFKAEDYSDGNIAVAFKDYMYDPKRQIALIYCLVHDEHLLQNVRIVVTRSKDEWRINLAQGTLIMPTAGIAKALECVRNSAAGENSDRQ